MATVENYTIRHWQVDKEISGGIPTDGFKDEDVLSITYREGSRICFLSWFNGTCSIQGLDLDTLNPKVEAQFGEKKIDCMVDLWHHTDGSHLLGTLKYSKEDNDGNTGTFMAEANSQSGDPE